EGLQGRERPRLAEAGDGTEYEVGLDGGERRVVAVQARHHAGNEVLDDDVGGAGEVEYHLARPWMAEVERDGELADVDTREVGALVGAPRLELGHAAPRVVALAGALDLDDARAEVAQQPRAVGAGQHAREVEHGETGEERVVGSHECVRYVIAPTL